jgi:hypothetical protein
MVAAGKPARLSVAAASAPDRAPGGAADMAFVISFSSTRFDVAGERPNPINPIAGESVLNWLRLELATANCQATAPATEDWGWYIDVTSGGTSYLVGASADASEPSDRVDWVIQVEKVRSLKDRMLGRNSLAPDDPLCVLIERLVRGDAGNSDVSVDPSQ